CQASCGGSPWFPVREVGPGNPILSDSTGEPPPSTFNYAWDIAHYKIPRYIRFVDELPMTVTGKVQKFVMRERMIDELKLDVQKTA
ncbi:hypothetical protein KTD26_20345, partial [Burkholderia multivorans]|uniref:hypothetical protein n=1 Tax=Burkholderia multivorans TaxID=87883 RepID=UPI001C21574C